MPAALVAVVIVMLKLARLPVTAGRFDHASALASEMVMSKWLDPKLNQPPACFRPPGRCCNPQYLMTMRQVHWLLKPSTDQKPSRQLP
jgi:hypothetical protein